MIGERIAVLGAAGQMQLHGASVTVYDPKAMKNSKALFRTLEYASSAIDACRGADATVVLTEWPEFCTLSPADLDGLVRRRNILDGRNCLDPKTWRGAGWEYRGMERR